MVRVLTLRGYDLTGSSVCGVVREAAVDGSSAGLVFNGDVLAIFVWLCSIQLFTKMS